MQYRQYRSRLWITHPDAAAEFPNEDGLTVLVTMFHRSRLATVRSPDPTLNAGRLFGRIHRESTPVITHPTAAPGLA